MLSGRNTTYEKFGGTEELQQNRKYQNINDEGHMREFEGIRTFEISMLSGENATSENLGGTEELQEIR